uniref:R-spondin Fu-CRD domain-containing protein n=1 Tax=Mastacembelus armatus TaxID=205130 RepID=A0A3Q3M295_9TELE
FPSLFISFHLSVPPCLSFSIPSHRETSDDCRSCLECSRDNGCMRCPDRLFLFLQRKGISHHGTCLHTCPAGHFGQRGKDVNQCMKCNALECEQCFSRDFCTKCRPGFQLYKGKCLTRCPNGTYADQTDCKDKCVQLGEWSEWSTCLHNGLTCGFNWGNQTRTRGGGPSGRTPEEKAASVCPAYTETQKCKMRKVCPTGEEGRREREEMKTVGAMRGRKVKPLLMNLTTTINKQQHTV